MKPNTLLCFAFVVLSAGLFAQDAENGKGEKNFLIVHGGAAIPTGNFASTSFDNEDAGMAKTGYTLNLLYGYQFSDYFGAMAQLHYANLPLASKFTEPFPGATADHWQYIGVLIGPMLYVPLTENTMLDFQVATGVMTVNSPKVKLSGTTIVDEDWGPALPLQAGVHFRFNTGNSMVIFGGGDYMYMVPKFSIPEADPPEVKQKISTISLQAGIGFRF
jgi:hypothetical protein